MKPISVFSRLVISVLFFAFEFAYSQGNVPLFDPPEQPRQFEALRVDDVIHVDGKLSEAAWSLGRSYNDFVQKDPYQEQPASNKTKIKILYDDKHLYVGAFCYDDLTKRANLRVQNMRRDFDYLNNDLFGMAIDGFGDKRNAIVIQTSPYGSQRDMQVFDDEVFNLEWDALWKVRTFRTDSGWVAEFAIPWKTIRYPKNCEHIGVIFVRNIRRLNEVDVLPAVPRSFDYRMSYEGLITSIHPPPPVANVQINPYILHESSKVKDGEYPSASDHDQKIGGDVKWAINTNSILDATINTDFAQADADRQVVNLSRFSILFPERRQFFLEGANIFNASVGELVQPFFSRRIGLDDNGNGIPLDGGLRFTNQSATKSVGALFIRQRETGDNPLTYFGIARYSKNLGIQNKLGGMITYRGEFPDTLGSQNNYTGTVDGLFRPHQSVTLKAMASGSKDDVFGDGFASQFWAVYHDNLVYLSLMEAFVNNYKPGVGIELFGTDYLYTGPFVEFDIRPHWLPERIRSVGPDIGLDMFHNPKTGDLIQAESYLSLLDIDFQTGANFEVRNGYSWQQLDEVFAPLDIVINPGKYQFGNTQISYRSDQSKKYSTELSYSWGKYFDGSLSSYSLSARLAPLPHLEFSGAYEFNQLRNLGENNEDKDTHLVELNTRFALNPRVQLIGFYQWSSAVERQVWNIRLAWEYQPLSYVYIVFNRNNIDSLNASDRYMSNELLVKFTFLKQF